MGITPQFYIDTIHKSPFYKRPPESFWKLLNQTMRELITRSPDWPRLIPAQTINKLIVAHCILSASEFDQRFTHYKRIALKFPRSPTVFWETMEIGVCSPEIQKAYLESIGLQYTENHETNPTPRPAPQKIPPLPIVPQPPSAIPKKLTPTIPRPRTLTVTEYILRHAPSKSCDLVYRTALSCSKNKRSKRGRKVYPYGQKYVAKLTRLPLRTVERAWAWLRRQGIINKALNENPRDHRCSLWYVCTSMKQVSYFLDLENRHRKPNPKT